MKTSTLVWVGGGLLVAIGSAVALQARREMSAEEMATVFRDCALRGDAECVHRMTDPREIRDNGTTIKQTELFLKEWFMPRFTGSLLPQGSITGSGRTGEQTFRYFVRTSKGDRSFQVSVAKTDDGLRVSRFTTALVAGAGAYGPDGLPLKGVEKLRNLAKYIRQEEGNLNRYGINRLYFGLGTTAMTIDESVADLERRILKATSSK